MIQTIILTEEEVKQALLEKYGGESVEINVGTTRECVDPWRNEFVTHAVFKDARITLKR